MQELFSYEWKKIWKRGLIWALVGLTLATALYCRFIMSMMFSYKEGMAALAMSSAFNFVFPILIAILIPVVYIAPDMKKKRLAKDLALGKNADAMYAVKTINSCILVVFAVIIYTIWITILNINWGYSNLPTEFGVSTVTFFFRQLGIGLGVTLALCLVEMLIAYATGSIWLTLIITTAVYVLDLFSTSFLPYDVGMAISLNAILYSVGYTFTLGTGAITALTLYTTLLPIAAVLLSWLLYRNRVRRQENAHI